MLDVHKMSEFINPTTHNMVAFVSPPTPFLPVRQPDVMDSHLTIEYMETQKSEVKESFEKTHCTERKSGSRGEHKVCAEQKAMIERSRKR